MDFSILDIIIAASLYSLIGALIGWITNYLAVKMLFYPKHPHRFLFFNVQGVFPRRQNEFALKMGELVSKELFTIDDVTKRLLAKTTNPESLTSIISRIEMIFFERLVNEIPPLRLVLKPRHINHVLRYCEPEIKSLIVQLSQRLASQLHEELDIEFMVTQKISAFTSEKLENILYAVMKREFRAIEVVGAVLGFVIGFSQFIIMTTLL